MAITNLLLSALAALTEPVFADGQAAALTVNKNGRLRTTTKPDVFPIILGDLTTIGTQVVADVSEASSILIHTKNTGAVTMAAGTFVFEGSVDSTDGVNGTWFPIQLVRSNANTVESTAALTGILAAAGNAYAWRGSVIGLAYFRVRNTVAVTATAIASWSLLRSPEAIESSPVIPTHAVTGSGNFSTAPAVGTLYSLVTAATTNGALIITATKALTEISIFNPTAAIIYVKLYNKATAPTVGTDVPIITIPVPIGGLVALEFGTLGKRFNLGIGIAVTAGAAATDVAAVAVGAQISATYL